MRFNCGPSPAERRRAKYLAKKARLEKWALEMTQWHRVFAWWPTRIDNGVCVWLEWYEERWGKAKVWDCPYHGDNTWKLSHPERRLSQ